LTNGQSTVAQARNHSYSGGRDWENHGLRPAWTKSSLDPVTTNDWAWCHMPVNPMTGKGAQTGGLQFKVAQV
jgi:hypothetical protein